MVTVFEFVINHFLPLYRHVVRDSPLLYVIFFRLVERETQDDLDKLVRMLVSYGWAARLDGVSACPRDTGP